MTVGGIGGPDNGLRTGGKDRRRYLCLGALCGFTLEALACLYFFTLKRLAL